MFDYCLKAAQWPKLNLPKALVVMSQLLPLLNCIFHFLFLNFKVELSGPGSFISSFWSEFLSELLH